MKYVKSNRAAGVMSLCLAWKVNLRKKGTTLVFTGVEQRKVIIFALSAVMSGCMKPETAGRAGNLSSTNYHTSDMGIPISTARASAEAFFLPAGNRRGCGRTP